MPTIHTLCCPRCWGSRFEPSGVGNACLLCDTKGWVEDCQLSEHFRFSELVHARAGFMNDPDVSHVVNLRRLARELLEPVRALTGPLRVTSGYRSGSYDSHIAEGSKRVSAHSIGAAADVQPMAEGKTLKDVIEAVQACGAAFDQAILEGGCCHLALLAPVNPGVQRGQALVRIPSGPGWRYLRYDGTPQQLALAR